MPHEELPFWHFNIPPAERTSECPDFLRHISDKDRRLIGKWDSDYQVLSWDRVQDIIRTNRIDQFERAPSDLRRYRHYIDQITREHGSVMRFVLRERLQWTDIIPKGIPFAYAEDIKILYNDWPYGVDPRIVHLVVWTKFLLQDDPKTDDLTEDSRKMVDEFVQKTFGRNVRQENIIWFRNWPSLKSVHAVEHFHVMLFDPDRDWLDELTGGDVPLSMKMPNMER